MREQPKVLAGPPSSLLGAGASGSSVQSLVAEIKSGWLRGEPADARAVLSLYPELRSDKSTVLDLAYEEYCLRQEAGATPNAEEFCARFPHYKTSLRRLIEAHSYLEKAPAAERRPLSWPETGDSFLGFALRRELGRGAFARVFLANDTELGDKWVVVKIARRGADEANTLGRLDGHPNVVPVLSVKKEELSGWTAVSMPYLGGATLCDVLDHAFAGSGLPRDARMILEAVRDTAQPDDPKVLHPSPHRLLRRGTYVDGILHLAVQLAEALSFVHQRGIYHGDLKPSNVLLTPDGRPMLMDFNLAFDPRKDSQRLGGTLPYLAPEQLLAVDSDGGPMKWNARSDLYAFGVLVYELFTGEHPFGPIPLKDTVRDFGRELTERQRRGPRPLRTLNPLVTPPIARAVEQCLAFAPADRPESAARVAANLRKQLGLLQVAKRWIAVHSHAVWGAILAMVGVSVLMSVLMIAKANDDRHQFDYGKTAFQNQAYEKAIGHFNRALVVQPDNPYAFVLRGRALQKLGNLDLAMKDLSKASQISGDGKIKACLGYCLNQRNDHGSAIHAYKQAIKAGFETPEVLNNLGYSYTRSPEYSSESARACFDKALGQNPNLQPAYYNRALLALLAADDPAGINDLLRGIADIEMAVQLGPRTGELHRYAASLYAVATEYDQEKMALPVLGASIVGLLGSLGGQGPLLTASSRIAGKAERAEKIGRALEHLKKAIELGENPNDLKKDNYFKNLRGKFFDKLMEMPFKPRANSTVSRLIDPIK